MLDQNFLVLQFALILLFEIDVDESCRVYLFHKIPLHFENKENAQPFSVATFFSSIISSRTVLASETSAVGINVKSCSPEIENKSAENFGNCPVPTNASECTK